MSANADDNKLICRLFCFFFYFPRCMEPRGKTFAKTKQNKNATVTGHHCCTNSCLLFLFSLLVVSVSHSLFLLQLEWESDKLQKNKATKKLLSRWMLKVR